MPVSLRSMQIVAHWFGDFPISHLLSVTFPAFSRLYSCGPLHPSSLILARCSGDLKREEEPCGGILDTVCDNSIQHTSKFEYPPTKMDSTSLPKNGGVFTDWELKRKLVRILKHQRSALHISVKASRFCFQLYIWTHSRLSHKKTKDSWQYRPTPYVMNSKHWSFEGLMARTPSPGFGWVNPQPRVRLWRLDGRVTRSRLRLNT
jgi:hypothetical protein